LAPLDIEHPSLLPLLFLFIVKRSMSRGLLVWTTPTVVRQSHRVGAAHAEGFPVGVHTDSPGVVSAKVLARGKSAKRSSTLQRRHGHTGGQHDPAGIGVRSGEEVLLPVAPTITVTTIDTENVLGVHRRQGRRAEGPVAAPPGAGMIVVTALPGNDIRPDDYNPSQMTDKAVKAHHAEVRRRGRPSKPLVVRPADGRDEIIDGEHGWAAAKAAGIAEVPCEIVEAERLRSQAADLSEEQARQAQPRPAGAGVLRHEGDREVVPEGPGQGPRCERGHHSQLPPRREG